MGRYKAYPAHKDSGITWLDEIPSHWHTAQVKHFYDVSLGKMLQPNQKSAQDALKPYLRAANIMWRGVQLDSIKEMWFSPEERMSLRLRSGDLLISEGGDVGRACFWHDELDECYFQNSINRARATGKAKPKYLYYWLSTLKDKGYIDVICNKSTISHYTAEKVQATPLIVPEAREQERIAAFLEYETSKIDTLIAKQRRLIELLQEKQQALISRAVTKGLNPNVPMKDSRVAWLGEVPEHWTVTKFKRVVSSFEQGWSPQCENRIAGDDEYGVLKVDA
jgi:type I restriction enzyme S subunit